MPTPLRHLRLDPGGALPAEGPQGPYQAIVLVRRPVDNDWRNRVSDWLVASGCLYMHAWGEECSKWDDAVDWAMLAAFDFGPIPDEQRVMTSWHEEEDLEELFDFVKLVALHGRVPLETSWVIDISDVDDEPHLQALWAAAPD